MKKVAIILFVLLPFFTFAQVLIHVPTGELLETKSDTVKIKIPFDEEYSISLDNQDNNRRALVKIRIDGQTVVDDGLILRRGEEVNLERFIDSSSLNKGKKFKFIEKTEEVKRVRRNNPEDGLIVITVQYEQAMEPLVKYKQPQNSMKIPQLHKWWYPLDSLMIIPCSGSVTVGNTSFSEGITVEGGESTQRFIEEKVGELENRIDTLVIHLVGYYKNPPILLNK